MTNDDWAGLTEDHDEHISEVTRMLAMWARSTCRDVESYRATAERMRVVDWAIEKGDYYVDPDREWQTAFEAHWIAAFRLITSAFQMENFLRVHREERGLSHDESPALRTLRNTLEHLDEAHFEWGTARYKEGATGKSITKMPDGVLAIAWSPMQADRIHGLISVDKLEERARSLSWYNESREHLEWEPSDIDIENMRYSYDDDITGDDDEE